MKYSIEPIVTLVVSGQYAVAAAKVSQLKASHGSLPELSIPLAQKAVSTQNPQFLSLAFALWPEALSSSCYRFVSIIGERQAFECTKLSFEFSQSLKKQLSSWVAYDEIEAQRVKKETEFKAALKAKKDAEFKAHKQEPCVRITRRKTHSTPFKDSLKG